VEANRPEKAPAATMISPACPLVHWTVWLKGIGRIASMMHRDNLSGEAEPNLNLHQFPRLTRLRACDPQPASIQAIAAKQFRGSQPSELFNALTKSRLTV
jgi:hypothetical protein